MADYQTIKERLISFISAVGLGKTQFEKECGLSHGWVNSIKKTVMPDKLESISLRFPELNTSWLMTGEGEMLRIDATSTPTDGMTEAQLRERIIALEKVIEEKDKRIAELQDGQEARINDLQEKVNTLAMALAEAMRKDR